MKYCAQLDWVGDEVKAAFAGGALDEVDASWVVEEYCKGRVVETFGRYPTFEAAANASARMNEAADGVYMPARRVIVRRGLAAVRDVAAEPRWSPVQAFVMLRQRPVVRQADRLGLAVLEMVGPGYCTWQARQRMADARRSERGSVSARLFARAAGIHVRLALALALALAACDGAVCAYPNPASDVGQDRGEQGEQSAGAECAVDGAPCDDGSECTRRDECYAGECAGSLVDCDDGDMCTRNVCAPVQGCMAIPITAGACGGAS
jgi:hypothetical protein